MALRLALVLAALASGCQARSTPGRTTDAGPPTFPALWARCLPACILALYADCAPTERCTVRHEGNVAHVCYANGVRERRQRDVAGGVITTTVRPDRRACVRKRATGSEILWESLEDLATARLALPTAELRTAFCDDDVYADVYRLPECAALEQAACDEGPCPSIDAN